MAGLFGNTTSAASTNAPGDPSKDIALTSPPEDSISDLSFSPAGDFLAVASWDKKVRIYQVSEQGQSEGKVGTSLALQRCFVLTIHRLQLTSKLPLSAVLGPKTAPRS